MLLHLGERPLDRALLRVLVGDAQLRQDRRVASNQLGAAAHAAEPPDETYIRRMIRREKAGERTTIRLAPHDFMALYWVVRWTARRGPMIEWAPDIFANVYAQFAAVLDDDPDGDALLRRGELVPFDVGPYTALMLHGAIEWALRSPQFATAGPPFLGPVADLLLGTFADEPAALEIISRLGGEPT